MRCVVDPPREIKRAVQAEETTRDAQAGTEDEHVRQKHPSLRSEEVRRRCYGGEEEIHRKDKRIDGTDGRGEERPPTPPSYVGTITQGDVSCHDRDFRTGNEQEDKCHDDESIERKCLGGEM